VERPFHGARPVAQASPPNLKPPSGGFPQFRPANAREVFSAARGVKSGPPDWNYFNSGFGAAH